MAAQRFKSLSDSSSDEEVHPGFPPPPKKRGWACEEEPPVKRQSVIVAQRVNSTSSAPSSRLTSSGASSSRDSDSSEGGFSSMSSVHQTLIKPKSSVEPVIDPKAKEMMRKMGFQEGTGLGKKSQGMVKPIEVSKQRGRRGLGLQIKGLEAEEVEWDFSQEVVEIEEQVSWIASNNDHIPTLGELRDWTMEGSRQTTIENETYFCDPEILAQVLQCKSIFDELEDEELRKARARSNPFETIRGGFFLNRAAMKMANLDAVFGFMFTDPRTEDGAQWIQPNELLYFADVCAGPGGFSEYFLWRKKWEAKGFGFTLKGNNDFKLEDFYAAPAEYFEPHYGVLGVDGDGDVYRSDNIREFSRFVLSQTDGVGVHVMMADGGFSVEGQENMQEILSKQLYLCQFLVALSIIRPGGHFVCKLFDVYTPFSAGIVYLMYRAFKQISIHKPNTSRPANSERYLVCKWKRTDTRDIQDYFFELNARLKHLSNSSNNTDVLRVVPIETLMDDRTFYEHLYATNNALGMRQVVNLAKIAAFCKDVSLREERQNELKKQSLHFWRIPDRARTAPTRTGPIDKAKELNASDPSVLSHRSVVISDVSSLQEAVKSVYDWRCVVLGSDGVNPLQSFFLGLGRNNVFRWDNFKSRWHKVVENVELPRDTLVYGELILELRGEGRSQKRSHALHIIDAIFLGGVDVCHLHMKERFEKCRQFVKALHKASRTDLVCVRVKENFKLEDVEKIFNRLDHRIIKNSGCQERTVFCLDDEDQRVFLPTGLLLYKITKPPWMLALSKSSGRKYWFHVHHRESVYDCPKESIATFFECHRTRLCWWWKNSKEGAGGFGQQHSSTWDMSKNDFISFVQSMMGK